MPAKNDDAVSVRAHNMPGRQIPDNTRVLAPTQVPTQHQINLTTEILLHANPRARCRPALGLADVDTNGLTSAHNSRTCG